MPLSIGDRLSAYEPATALGKTVNPNAFSGNEPGTQMTRSGLNKMDAWKIATYVQVNRQYCARRTEVLG
jgi:hypothetical protein